MGTNPQYYNAMTSTAYLMSDAGVTAWYELNSTQIARLNEAAGLWDDVSNFSAIQAVDSTDLARESTTYTTEYFLGIPYNSYWNNSLPHDWTRVAVGDFSDNQTLGVNQSYGDNNRYHEVYINSIDEGVWSFELGSRAFDTVIHEIGHSFEGGHISGANSDGVNPRVASIMVPSDSNNSSIWYDSTPMTLDIDSMIAQFGASTTTRTGNDVYGFNASFSGPYRSAFDFSVNHRPLVTIYDNGGTDTLDASGFFDAGGNPQGVHVDLQSGSNATGTNHTSYLIGQYDAEGWQRTFAVIYRTSVIENGTGGGGNDELIGNAVGNVLDGNGGNDYFQGLGGADTIYGDAGLDTAAYLGARGSYSVTLRSSDGAILVNGGSDGGDTLYSVERINFAGTNYSVYQLGLDDFASDVADHNYGNIAVGGHATGGVGYNGDHDWFAVNLLAGHRYVIHDDGSGTGGGTLSDTKLSLLNSYGVALATNDDHAGTLSSELDVQVSRSGTYYLDAFAYSSNVGSYNLSIVDAGTTTFSMSGGAAINNFSQAQGWSANNLYPRTVGFADHDHMRDIVGFGQAGVLVSTQNSDGSFDAALPYLSNFGQAQGWSSDNLYHRELADVNGDGFDDIVGFGQAGVWVALNNSTGGTPSFASAFNSVANFAVGAGGWLSEDANPRHLADINGDGRADIVGFGQAGVYVALSSDTAGHFGSVQFAAPNFGQAQGWSSDNIYHRELADVNNDGRTDIVGFGQNGVFVSLNTSSAATPSFGSATQWLNSFGAAAGWSSQDAFPRHVGDVNGDGYADLVGYGQNGTWIALNNHAGGFSAPTFDLANFGQAEGWSSNGTYPRLLADMNGDGLADTIGFGANNVQIANAHNFLLV